MTCKCNSPRIGHGLEDLPGGTHYLRYIRCLECGDIDTEKVAFPTPEELDVELEETIIQKETVKIERRKSRRCSNKFEQALNRSARLLIEAVLNKDWGDVENLSSDIAHFTKIVLKEAKRGIEI